MRHLAWLAMLLVSAAGFLRESWGQDRGTVQGVVTQVEAQKPEGAPAILVVYLKGEGVWEAKLSATPDNHDAYAKVEGLKKGDRVTIGWTRAGEINLIREIRVDARAGEAQGREGDNPDAARAEAERRQAAEREAAERLEREDKEKNAAAAEGAKRAAEAGQAAERTAKENAEQEARAKKEAARAAEAAAMEKKKQEMEAVRKDAAVREEAARREAEARAGQKPAAGRQQTKVSVVSVATQEAEHGEGARILRVKPLEGGEAMNFTVAANRQRLYEILGELQAGEKILVTWVTEGGHPSLVDIGKAD